MSAALAFIAVRINDQHRANEATLAAFIAVRSNDQHRAKEANAREFTEGAVAVGRLLIEAKAQVGHGNWTRWIADNCVFDEREAQGYVQVASQLPEGETVVDFEKRLGGDR